MLFHIIKHIVCQEKKYTIYGGFFSEDNVGHCRV